jgi:hypothetical protein
MENRHQRHLFATYLALLQLAEEIRTLATRGATPGGAARRMPPLPDAEWVDLERDLHALLSQVRAAVERHAPAMLAEHESPSSTAATRRWVAVLLGRAADLATEFEPERVARRFGAIAAEEADDLGAVAAAIRAEVDRLLSRCRGDS